MSLFEQAIQRGDRASQPAANSVIIGTLYFVTDENVTERSNGTNWESYSASIEIEETPIPLIQQILIEDTIIEESIPIPGPTGPAGVGGGGSGGGKIAQVVNFQTGEVIRVTGTIPVDDSIPQITEGTEIMLLAITPTDATSKLRIDVSAYTWLSTSGFTVIALFKDTVANALACMPANQSGGIAITRHFVHFMTAGTTSLITFTVRMGSDTAGDVMTLNGADTVRRYGGSIASSITITEITP